MSSAIRQEIRLMERRSGGGIWDEHLPWDWPLDLQSLLFGRPRLEDFIINDWWSPPAHDKIIQHALGPCGVPQDVIDQIKAGSKEWDEETGTSTLPELVNSHAMMARGQNPEEAIRGRINFTENRLNTARDAYRQNDYGTAWRQIGVATHGPADATSPAHTDRNGNPIIWCGVLGLCRGSNVGEHSRNESSGIERVADLDRMGDKVYNITDQAIRNAYSSVTGRQLTCH